MNSTVPTDDSNFATFQHEGICCDQCHVNPIVGIRYRCSMCANYDLCESCLIRNENLQQQQQQQQKSPRAWIFDPPFHDPTHIFYRLVGDKPSLSNQKEYPIIVARDTAIHAGIICSTCSISDPKGYLYKCQECHNINLCEACEYKGVHNPNHTRLKVAVPSRESQLLSESRAEVARLKEQLAQQSQRQQKQTQPSNNDDDTEDAGGGGRDVVHAISLTMMNARQSNAGRRID